MIFKPTGTSEALIKAVKPYLTTGKLLDLGCGCGIVGRSLLKYGIEVYASDIDPEAIISVGYPDEEIITRSGSLFEPWELWKFDFIVDDVSGVAEDIPNPWFHGVSCKSGKDGADLICKVIEQAPEHLEPNGKLFFPIVSLSNSNRILNHARKHFKEVKLLSHTKFPLPKEMQDYKYPEGYTKEKFGIKLFWTDIYLAQS
jgi:methylase of polypeptide subunit release factors